MFSPTRDTFYPALCLFAGCQSTTVMGLQKVPEQTKCCQQLHIPTQPVTKEIQGEADAAFSLFTAFSPKYTAMGNLFYKDEASMRSESHCILLMPVPDRFPIP